MSLMQRLVKRLAIPLSNLKTVAKWLVIAIRLGCQPKNFWPGTRKTPAKSLDMPHRYSDIERAAIYRVIAERRDMRHFRNDPIPAEILQRVLHAAHQAPSVGLMQPWRFIRISDPALREQVHALVDAERHLTAQIGRAHV